MPDYSKGCIYMIKKQDDYNNDNIYIGSCCNFNRRKCGHKIVCNNPNNKNHNLKVYQFIRDNGGWDSWCMTKIIDYPCNSKSELNTMERHYVDEYKSKLNCNIPSRTYKEWCDDNKDKIKEYYNDNKDKILKFQKQYYNDNTEKLKKYHKQYSHENKHMIRKINEKYYNGNKDKIAEQRKQYRKENADKIKEYGKQYIKQYYLENKDKIAEKLAEKVKCDNCGCNVRKDYLVKHKRTQKCINFKPK